MERETRFELATSTLARLHSTTELFPPIQKQRQDNNQTHNKTQPEIEKKLPVREGHNLSGGNADNASKCIAEECDCIAKNRHNIKAIGIMPHILLGDEVLCRTAQDLLFLPIHEFPGFSELT